MDFEPAGRGRTLVSLLVLAVLAGLAAVTMEAGRYRSLTWVLLGFFAARVMLTRAGSR